MEEELSAGEISEQTGVLSQQRLPGDGAELPGLGQGLALALGLGLGLELLRVPLAQGGQKSERLLVPRLRCRCRTGFGGEGTQPQGRGWTLLSCHCI